MKEAHIQSVCFERDLGKQRKQLNKYETREIICNKTLPLFFKHTVNFFAIDCLNLIL